MSEIRQGQVYWIDLDHAAGSAAAERRRHPCVVVQNDVFNGSAIPTSVVCVITSNLSRANAPGNVLLKAGEAGLAKGGVVNVSQIFTVDKAELTERAGALSGPAVRAVRNGVCLLFERM